MELGIIGLPTSGKTTVFNALTGSDRPTAMASSGKLEIHSAVVDVPDARIDQLSAMYKPKKTAYAKVTYTDIAGLDADLGKKGLTGELRNKIAPMDAFVMVVRAFEDEMVPHVFDTIDPQRDLENFESEFMLADLVTVENLLERLEERLKKGARGDEGKDMKSMQALLERLVEPLSDGIPLRDIGLTAEEIASVHGYSLLSLKPMLILLNTGDEELDPTAMLSSSHQHTAVMAMQGKLEMEISQLEPDEAEMFMEEFGISTLANQRVIQESFKLVGLHSFFTVGEDEVRAWNIPTGAVAVEAAGTIHTDLARGFIRAEVVAYEDLIAGGDMAGAKKAGKVRLEGKQYLVHDGDIMHIRFSV